MGTINCGFYAKLWPTGLDADPIQQAHGTPRTSLRMLFIWVQWSTLASGKSPMGDVDMEACEQELLRRRHDMYA